MEREPGQYTFTTPWYRVVDLATGTSEPVDLPASYTGNPLAMSWDSDGPIAVDVHGRPTGPEEPPTEAWTVDPVTGDSASSPLTGVMVPGLGISATYPVDTDPVTAVAFETSTRQRPVPRAPCGPLPGRRRRHGPSAGPTTACCSPRSTTTSCC